MASQTSNAQVTQAVENMTRALGPLPMGGDVQEERPQMGPLAAEAVRQLRSIGETYTFEKATEAIGRIVGGQEQPESPFQPLIEAKAAGIIPDMSSMMGVQKAGTDMIMGLAQAARQEATEAKQENNALQSKVLDLTLQGLAERTNHAIEKVTEAVSKIGEQRKDSGTSPIVRQTEEVLGQVAGVALARGLAPVLNPQTPKPPEDMFETLLKSIDNLGKVFQVAESVKGRFGGTQQPAGGISDERELRLEELRLQHERELTIHDKNLALKKYELDVKGQAVTGLAGMLKETLPGIAPAISDFLRAAAARIAQGMQSGGIEAPNTAGGGSLQDAMGVQQEAAKEPEPPKVGISLTDLL